MLRIHVSALALDPIDFGRAVNLQVQQVFSKHPREQANGCENQIREYAEQ